MTRLALPTLLVRCLHTAILLALAGLALCVFAQVVMRYMLSSPPFWTEELARFLLIWITFIGAVAVQITRDHIGVTWLSDQLPLRPRAALEAIKSVIVLAVLIFITKAGYDVARTGTQLSPALGLSMRLVYGSLPVGAALTCVVVVVQLWGEIRILFTGAGEEICDGD